MIAFGELDVISLNGKWTVANGQNVTCAATVPGVIHLDLLVCH